MKLVHMRRPSSHQDLANIPKRCKSQLQKEDNRLKQKKARKRIDWKWAPRCLSHIAFTATCLVAGRSRRDCFQAPMALSLPQVHPFFSGDDDGWRTHALQGTYMARCHGAIIANHSDHWPDPVARGSPDGDWSVHDCVQSSCSLLTMCRWLVSVNPPCRPTLSAWLLLPCPINLQHNLKTLAMKSPPDRWLVPGPAPRSSQVMLAH